MRSFREWNLPSGELWLTLDSGLGRYSVNRLSRPQQHKTNHRECICNAKTRPPCQPVVRCFIRRCNAAFLTAEQRVKLQFDEFRRVRYRCRCHRINNTLQVTSNSGFSASARRGNFSNSMSASLSISSYTYPPRLTNNAFIHFHSVFESNSKCFFCWTFSNQFSHSCFKQLHNLL